MLRLVRPDEHMPPPPPSPGRRRLMRLRLPLAVVGAAAAIWLAWWLAMSDVRAIRALPDEQRLPLLRSTLENLKNICDPAAPVSLRAFCRQQAELATKFRECDDDPICQQVARRHLYQPHR